MPKWEGSGVVVIGLGRFGEALARELVESGTEVLAIDADPKLVQQYAGTLTHAVIADATDEQALRQLGVQDFDRVVVAIGELESSILACSILETMGVRDVWAKALTEPHARILKQLGVRHVVLPEHDMGRRVAHLVAGRLIDYIEFDDGYAIVKMWPPAEIFDVPLGESGVRRRYGVTVVGVKRKGEDFTHATQDTVVHDGDVVIVSGPRRKVEDFAEMR